MCVNRFRCVCVCVCVYVCVGECVIYSASHHYSGRTPKADYIPKWSVCEREVCVCVCERERCVRESVSVCVIGVCV